MFLDKVKTTSEIHDILKELYKAIRESIKESMSKYTLADLILKYDSYES